MRSLLIGAVCLCVGGAIGYLGRDVVSPPTMQVAQGPTSSIVPATQRTTEAAAEEEAVEVAEAETAEPEATDAEAGSPREAIGVCVTCHGVDGIAKIPIAPHLAGESRVYIETQLKAFRTGKREHEMMTVIAGGMSDAEIKAVAKWYSAIKITAEMPE